MLVRALFVTTCLAANAAYLTWSVPDAPTSRHAELETLPRVTGPWHGQSVPLDPAVLDVLPVDTYTHRYYTDRSNRRVNLYVGYHGDTRTALDLAPHSPLLCLPGLGWQPTSTGRIVLALEPNQARTDARTTVTVTRVVVARGLDRQVVLFWYQVNGQPVADEYALKGHLIANVLHARTSNVALVRVAVAVDGRGASAESHADRAAREFAMAIFDDIQRRLPS